MSYKIIFSSDGILKIFYSFKQESLPLFDIQKISQQDNNSFWNIWSSSEIMFEKGLTFKSFMYCLEPWKDYFSQYLNIDLSSYIKEIKRSNFKIVNSNNSLKIEDDEPFIPFDWIEVGQFLELKPETKYETEDASDINNFLKSRKKLTGKWLFNQFYSICGFYCNNNESYSVESISLEKIANVPLVLKEETLFMIDNHHLKSNQYNLIDKNGFGVYSEKDFFYDVIFCNQTHYFEDVLRGVFNFFNYSPKDRDDEYNHLKKLFSEIENNTIEKINSEKIISNVIPLNADFNQQNSVLESLVSENNIWEHWKKYSNVQKSEIFSNEPLEFKVYKNTLQKNDIIKSTDWLKD